MNIRLSMLLTAALLGVSTSSSIAAPSAGPDTVRRLIVKVSDSARCSKVLSAASAVQGTSAAALGAMADARLSEHLASRGISAKGVQMPFGEVRHRLIDLGREMSGQEALSVIDELKSLGCVEYAAPDIKLRATAVPNDPKFINQWYLTDPVGGINMPSAWDNLPKVMTLTRVAILDTGIASNPDNTIWAFSDSDPGTGARWRVCDNSTSDYPSSWHGTRVDGIIAARTDNGYGVSGIAGGFGGKSSNIENRHYKVLFQCDEGDLSVTVGAIQKAVDDAAGGSGIRQVINLSLSSKNPTSCPAPLQEAINYATAKGVPVVVGAGNNAQSTSQFAPANCSGVVVVGASSRSGGRASYSNFGPQVTISAPGGDGETLESGIITARNPGVRWPLDNEDRNNPRWFSSVQGTSFSAPQVSATLALLFAGAPAMSIGDAVRMMTSTARPFPQGCSGCGAGILDVGATIYKAFPPKRGPNPPDCKVNPRLCARTPN